MLNIFKLAIKNTLRNKRRTVLTTLMIIIGVVVILFSNAFLQSMTHSWKDDLINADLGHFQIMQKGYKENRASFTMDYTIPDASSLAINISKEPGIISATKRVSIGGLISTGNQTSPFFGSGIDVVTAGKTLPNLYNKLIKGKSLSDQAGGAILGEGLARRLNTKIGDVLMLATYDKYKAMNAVAITVRGIVKIPEDNTNDRLVLTDYKTACSLVSFGDEATEIVVRTKDITRTKESMKGIREKYSRKNLEFYEWGELAGQLKQVEGLFMAFSTVVSLIIYTIVLVGLANTILMGVFERTREIGTLMAIGSSRGQIMGIFIAESIWLGVIGIVIGVLIHVLLLMWLARTGIPMSPPGTDQKIMIYPMFNWGQFVSTGISVIIVSIIAAVYPSRFASRLNPIDAIRSNQ